MLALLINHNTTCYQWRIAQKFEGEKRANPRINIKSHLPCREGLPEGSPSITGFFQWSPSFQAPTKTLYATDVSPVVTYAPQI